MKMTLTLANAIMDDLFCLAYSAGFDIEESKFYAKTKFLELTDAFEEFFEEQWEVIDDTENLLEE